MENKILHDILYSKNIEIQGNKRNFTEEKMKELHVAVVGLRFGKSFAQIFRAHPAVGEVTLFDPDAEKVTFLVRNMPGVRVASSFEEILEDPSIDAVHLVSPSPSMQIRQ